MGFIRQVWTLTLKDLLLVLGRKWFTTPVRAFFFPIIFMFFISYAKNFFVPPANFGIGTPTPIRSFPDALEAIGSDRPNFVLITNGYTTGNISSAISQLQAQAEQASKTVYVLQNDTELSRICRGTLRGVSQCAGAIYFHSAPGQPRTNSMWNYTLMADGALGTKIFANRNDNDVELYILPLQRATDQILASISGATPLPTVYEQLYTNESNAGRAANITRLYQKTLINILAVAFFIGICGITYQLTGHVAREREIGMSQLTEAMMPNKYRWQPQAARLMAVHLAFDIIYLPGWIIMGVVIDYLVYPQTNAGIFVLLHVLIGFALASYSLFCATFFRKAQVSGITIVLISIVMAIVAQIPLNRHASNGAVIILGLIFPPCAYTFFLIGASGWQQRELSVHLASRAPSMTWTVPLGALLGIMAVQIVVYPFLAALMERLFYNTASKTRTLTYNAEPSRYAVRLNNFSKHYTRGWLTRFFCCGRKGQVVKAVNDLTMNLLSGSITILLGANGSGKSTTLNAISGLDTVTHGSIEIDGTGGLGLCPQKNVMWDNMTVYEHVWVFDRLKSTGKRATKIELIELITACDLGVKVDAMSRTLSGGQKRKLQLAMMFAGGSRVCCVDEVSSGIDPLARRKIWDILLAERGRRSILLTTHFLDEADVLSDHIAILSKGILRAEGSAVELKHNLGGGYRVYVDRAVAYAPAPSTAAFTAYSDYEYNVYQVADSTTAAIIIAELEKNGVEDYRVQGPTIEDVFLKLAEEIKTDLGGPHLSMGGQAMPEKEGNALDGSVVPVSGQKMTLSTGNGTGLLRQAWILFCKRFVVLRSSYVPHVLAFLLPVITGALVTLFVVGTTTLSCDPGENATPDYSLSLETLPAINAIYGPPNLLPPREVYGFNPQLNASTVHAINTLDQFHDAININYTTILPGGVFVAQQAGAPLMSYLGNQGPYYGLVIQNLLNSILSRNPVTTQYMPFNTPFSPTAGDTLQVILYFGLAMCAFPGFFALYPTSERIRKVRALHYSNGVRSLPIWSAYILFDFIWVLIISAIIAIIWAAQWNGWYGLGYVFVIFFLYGLASIALSYCVSLFVYSQLAAFAFSAGIQCVFFLVYFIAYLATITYGPVDQIDNWITIEHFTIALICPSCSLLRALLLTLNEFSLLCRGNYFKPIYPGEIVIYGGPILYLIVQFLLMAAFVVYWDAGGRFSWFWKRDSKSRDVEESEMANKEAVEDLSRLASNNDGLRVLHVSKSFGSNRAVDDITFGIQKSEVFALLGPNGAGKSTTISLIRGDIRPTGTRGEVFVENHSLQHNRTAARNSLGVCPQFDAMDSMTVVEHLKFYARARGVPEVSRNVEQVMSAVGLIPYAKRMAAKLSGGNKRKLSLAISLMGNPAVVLLDEPSSGMDAAAKRVMWKVLASVSPGRALLITTHSMEEADALANRAGIMARNMLALGTSDELRRRHGDAYHVHLVHKDAPHTSRADMDIMSTWVRNYIPGAIVEERTYHGQLRFSVPNSSTASAAAASKALEDSIASSESSSTNEISKDGLKTIVTTDDSRKQRAGRLFELLERHKDELGFAYYSVAPTTLDQVFLNVVNKHNVEEENYQSQSNEAREANRSHRKRQLGTVFGSLVCCL